MRTVTITEVRQDATTLVEEVLASKEPKTMAVDLASQTCVACEGGMPSLSREEAERLMPQLADRWRLAEDTRSLEANIRFKSFVRAMVFLQRLADVAEQEGHHPDFCLHDWNKVSLKLTTHAIGGLSTNDFVLAAKLDRVVRPPTADGSA